MAMTPAEKQRRYRDRHLSIDGQKERLQCMISVPTKAKLTRLAHYHGYSVTALIETLVADAERALLDTLHAAHIGPYLDGRLQCNRSADPQGQQTQQASSRSSDEPDAAPSAGA